jgi:outer membrane protein assembly factor BamB
MNRKKAALAVIGAFLFIIGCLVAFIFYTYHQGRDHLGSPTVEYVPTETAPPPTASPKIVWPEFGYDPERSHVGPASVKLRPPFRRVWRAGGATLFEFPPAIAYGRLFLADGAGRVLAISTKTGARAWKFDSHRCQAASPAVDDFKHGTIFEVFLNRRPCKAKNPADGEVVALSAGRGKVRWTRHIGASETSPAVVGNRLYVGDWLGHVYALDKRTGRIVWTASTGGAVKGGIAVSGKQVYAGSYDGHLYAFNARTGHLLWRGSGDPRLFGHGQFYSTPAAAYGRVYIGSTDGKVYSFGATSGRRIWSRSTGGYVYGSPAVWQQIVFAGSYSHAFYAFDAATGETRWTFKANGPISGSATVIDGVVYFATLTKQGRTYALNARTGHLLWSFPDGRYTPVVADKNHLYLVGYGRLYAFAPR